MDTRLLRYVCIFFESYYLIDENALNQKYDSFLKKENLKQEKETLTKHGKKVINFLHGEGITYFIFNESAIFKAYGKQKYILRNQKGFDTLNIDYIVLQD